MTGAIVEAWVGLTLAHTTWYHTWQQNININQDKAGSFSLLALTIETRILSLLFMNTLFVSQSEVKC